MFRIALKSVLARKRRLLLTSIAILLGVAFISGTSVLSDVLTRSVDELVSDAYHGVDAVVRDSRAQDNLFSSQPIRPPIDQNLSQLIQSAAGVRAVAPVIQAAPTLLDRHGKRVSNFGPPTIAANWITDPALSNGTITKGHAPQAPDQAVMDFSTAKSFGFHVGDPVTLQFTSGAATFHIVGIGGLGPKGNKTSGSRFISLQLPRLQALTDQVGKVNYFSVAAKPGVTQRQLQATLQQIVPGHVEVLTGNQFVAETQKQIEQLLNVITDLVSAFGFIAAFVAIFVIYNTFSIIVAQRTREMALLRAVGASRRQILFSVMAEAFMVGLIAAVVGLLAGFGLATGLKVLLGNFLTVTGGLPHLTAQAVERSLLVGILVSVLSALWPALRATRIPPVAAMTDVAVDTSALSLGRKIIGPILLLIGAGLVLLGVKDTSLDTPLEVVGLGAALIFISLLVFGPVFAGPVALVLGRPIQTLFGTPGRIARQNAARNPKRTIATAVALTIGVALVTVIGVIAASFKGTFASVYENQIHADLIVDSGGQGGGGFAPAIKDRVRAVPGVETVASTRFFGGCVLNSKAAKANAAESTDTHSGCEGNTPGVNSPRGEQVFLIGVDTPSIFKIIELGKIKPSTAALQNDTLMVSKAILDDNHWKVGDTVDIRFQTTRHFKIAASFDKPFGQGSYFMNLHTFNEVAPAALQVDNDLYVRVQDKTALATVQKRIESVLAGPAPAATVEDLGTYVRQQTQQLEGFLNLVYGMLALAVIVAIVGIYNTLSLSVFERTREIGLLRAVGMERRQIRRSVRWESVIVSLFGTAMGIGLGIAFAVAAVSGFSDQGVVLTLPGTQLIVYAVGGAIAGVVASIFPARTASRTDILQAISTN
jgi:putative ABC transport system permease protein